MKDVTRLVAVVALVVALMAAAIRVQAERERRYPSQAIESDTLSEKTLFDPKSCQGRPKVVT